ncbi:MAG: hypothetical protein LBV69_02740, partial [Bacteroidales bacterium]|nr:hypothetical protein [Bacteroidales bacterium]
MFFVRNKFFSKIRKNNLKFAIFIIFPVAKDFKGIDGFSVTIFTFAVIISGYLKNQLPTNKPMIIRNITVIP